MWANLALAERALEQMLREAELLATLAERERVVAAAQSSKAGNDGPVGLSLRAHRIDVDIYQLSSVPLSAAYSHKPIVGTSTAA